MIEDATKRRKRLTRGKHRWLTACALFPALRDSPLQMRLAILLWDHFNAGIGYAFPSRERLADRLGVDPTNVSHALRRLSDLRIITLVRVRDLPEATRKMMNRHDRRARAYTLNEAWADEVLAEAESEPTRLLEAAA